MEHWVAFPKLGIELTVPQSVAQFTLFGIEFDIRFYGCLIVLGLLLAVVYAYVQAPRVGVDRERMLDVVLGAAVVAVLCTRLYYVLFSGELDYYLAHPVKIFAIWDGGMGIYGGIIGAFVSGLLLCKWRKVDTLALFDLAGIGFLIGQGIGRWGNFFNQEAYGGNTDLPWGMTGDIIQKGVNGVVENPYAPVHPTFLYESLWCLLGVLILHLMFKKRYKFKGQIFASYLIWYGAERLLVESLRSDSLYFGPFRVSQLVAVAAMALGVTLLFVLNARAKKQAVALAAQESSTLTLGDDDEPTTEEEAEDGNHH